MTSHAEQLDVPAAAPSHDYLLSKNQLVLVAIIGVVLWFAFALYLNFAGQAGWFGPVASAIHFAVCIPLAWVTVRVFRVALGLRPGQVLPALALGTAAATLCDASALTWYPALYGTDPAVIVLEAAAILWFVGVSFPIAYWEGYRG